MEALHAEPAQGDIAGTEGARLGFRLRGAGGGQGAEALARHVSGAGARVAETRAMGTEGARDHPAHRNSARLAPPAARVVKGSQRSDLPDCGTAIAKAPAAATGDAAREIWSYFQGAPPPEINVTFTIENASNGTRRISNLSARGRFSPRGDGTEAVLTMREEDVGCGISVTRPHDRHGMA